MPQSGMASTAKKTANKKIPSPPPHKKKLYNYKSFKIVIFVFLMNTKTNEQ